MDHRLIRLERIKVSDLPIQPELRQIEYTKDKVIAIWIKDWINRDYDILSDKLLPNKKVLAKYLQVSQGTIQAALKRLHNEGLVESKQRLGTIVLSRRSCVGRSLSSVSKYDIAVSRIKSYIVSNNMTKGQKLPVIKDLSRIIGMNENTIRTALIELEDSGFISNFNELNIDSKEVGMRDIEDYSKKKSLVDIVQSEILKYLKGNGLRKGDKIGSQTFFANKFRVSVKTIQLGMQNLVKKGILSTFKGQYGTILLKDLGVEEKLENSVRGEAVQVYNYEKVESKLRTIIVNEYEIGDRLPSMKSFALRFRVSVSTVKRAFSNLNKENIVQFSQGRYGGTFVTDNIDVDCSSDISDYKWLCVSELK